ncbi:hypothetical protein IWX46DRAFT_445126 [Phyllosticta citricarpa]|uniref:Uncharacterized protein n=1 Tax=Phyllosticta citricarpa TaxID=55181 RepID=A0ABR1MIA5_9PEZI
MTGHLGSNASISTYLPYLPYLAYLLDRHRFVFSHQILEYFLRLLPRRLFTFSFYPLSFSACRPRCRCVATACFLAGWGWPATPLTHARTHCLSIHPSLNLHTALARRRGAARRDAVRCGTPGRWVAVNLPACLPACLPTSQTVSLTGSPGVQRSTWHSLCALAELPPCLPIYPGRQAARPVTTRRRDLRDAMRCHLRTYALDLPTCAMSDGHEGLSDAVGWLASRLVTRKPRRGGRVNCR